METQLTRIAEVAKTRPNEKFTSLAHLINEESLKDCHQQMSRKKSAGIDQVTKDDYELNLEDNLKDLVHRLKRQAYKPQPVRRVYIPKPGTDKKRPLGIPAYEDKLVQAVLAKMLNSIYEPSFLECSFGFRPNRGCHDALKVLNMILNRKEINYVVDADIRAFFDHVDHEWMLKFLQHRIADPNLLRLIVRFLKSGIIEAGVKYDTPEGTPQGGGVSPILANIYLHYVLDLWFEKKVRKACRGSVYMVRYADDTVFCFEYEEEAKQFYSQMIIRLKEFNLEVADEKTKIVCLGKDDDDEDKPGEPKESQSFDFLGFTHYRSEGKDGVICILRKTSKKKYRASLLRCKEWIKNNRHIPTKDFMKKLKIKLQGYCRYYGITGNRPAVSNFIDEVKRLIFKWLNRRSQRKSFGWDKFNLFLKKYPLPQAKTYVNIRALKAGLSYVL
ncbi:Group II intron-encoded protein LtrA [Sporomusa ovata DSM 2662]|uniref:Retron-type RNA-directed DNA polymerase n=1 Tax=Sporomusa ovata TaxID=2378 RepID=A0A0U1KUE8_9FIRM|nr:group II intron reverse transcriptase/maturase [Sporomusa ovata]EQB26422.1 group II intron-encoded protein LtrA [Sporomusa ovata DSM 2662]CQR70503.1 Retron-type RNA-directed DNA polymerase [Sporomusa ovata]